MMPRHSEPVSHKREPGERVSPNSWKLLLLALAIVACSAALVAYSSGALDRWIACF